MSAEDDCACKAAARRYGTFEGPVGDDWWVCYCQPERKTMSNHIGKAIKNNPIEAFLVALLVIVIIGGLNLTYRIDRAEKVCVVEATPVQQ